MILARDWLGVSKPTFPFIIDPGRIVAAKIEFPGCPPFCAISAYMVTGKGIEDENLQLLDAIGVAGASTELPVVLGADFQ
eukprot:8428972-Heterocapsa_arctica.AAC.1